MLPRSQASQVTATYEYIIAQAIEFERIHFQKAENIYAQKPRVIWQNLLINCSFCGIIR